MSSSNLNVGLLLCCLILHVMWFCKLLLVRIILELLPNSLRFLDDWPWHGIKPSWPSIHWFIHALHPFYNKIKLQLKVAIFVTCVLIIINHFCSCRRQVFWISKQILQLVMEDAIDDWLLGQINWLRREETIAQGIQWLQDVSIEPILSIILYMYSNSVQNYSLAGCLPLNTLLL